MSITNRYYRDTDAIIIVYDCCAEDTFFNIDKWCTEVNTYLAPQLDDGMPVLLVANKKDKIPDMESPNEVVNFRVAQELATNKGLFACVETSAKSGEGIKELFEKIAKEIMRCRGPKSAGRVDRIQNRKGKCC